ncbi:MAG: proline dehydrogenase family protein [Patescibacteria group bacterium]
MFTETAITVLYPLLHKSFIGGRNEKHAMQTLHKISLCGMVPISNMLGEEVYTREQAMRNANAYLRHIQMLARVRVSGDRPVKNVSLAVKPSHLGILVLTNDEFQSILEALARECASGNIECMVDAEDTEINKKAYPIIKKIHAMGNVFLGACFQANDETNRMEYADFLEQGIRVRIVKGAYIGTFEDNRDVSEEFFSMMRDAVKSKSVVELGTHDIRLLGSIVKHLGKKDISKNRVRIQMLYGIGMDMQTALAEGDMDRFCETVHPSQWYVANSRRDEFSVYGYKNVMTYVPWGSVWVGRRYLLRRVAEGMRFGLMEFFLKNVFESLRWQYAHRLHKRF